MNNKQLLKEAYSDIIRGYSKIFFDKKPLFIKHFNSFDSFLIDEYHNYYYQEAINNKIPSNEERIKFLRETGGWSDKKDEAIKDKKFFIENLRATKSKVAMLKSQHDHLAGEIDKATLELRKLEFEKSELLGITAEAFANRKANEKNIAKSFYKDVERGDLYFSDEDFDNLEDTEFAQYIELYNTNSEKFIAYNIKKIALSAYFLNFFFLCDNDPVKFYGKPVINLTFHQVELFSQGCYFKNILSEMKNKLPADILEDPDQLIAMYDSNKSAEGKFKDGNDGKPTNIRGIMGATKEDYIRMGMENQLGPDLREIAAKKGGKLDIGDIAKALGEVPENAQFK